MGTILLWKNLPFMTRDGFSLITYLLFLVYWIIYTLSGHCFHSIPKPDTTIAMHNQNWPCLKNKNNNWAHSVFRCLFETCLFLFCEISILLLVSKTHWEKDGFFSVKQWNLEEKRHYFWIKYCEKLLERLF